MSTAAVSPPARPGAVVPHEPIAPGQTGASPAPLGDKGTHANRPPRAASRKPAPVPGATRPGDGAPTGRAPNRPLDSRATDDEILGIGDELAPVADSQYPDGEPYAENAAGPAETAAGIPENLRETLDANPELRRVWDDAQAYRETFATPDAARAAVAQLADLDRLDALFFSRRPEDHTKLARAVASLDPAAFASLAQAMSSLAANAQAVPGANPSLDGNVSGSRENAATGTAQAAAASPSTPAGAPTNAQVEFFQAANEASVRGVIEAIESQVERLLPEGVSRSARNRVVGEIYRELDATLRSNRQLGEQMRQSFRSGSLDAAHQRAVVSLVTGRARQALPAVARRVMSEWTSTLVAANQDRRARQRAAERRVDIAGASGGNDGRRSMTPRDIDYARLSDSDILNL